MYCFHDFLSSRNLCFVLTTYLYSYESESFCMNKSKWRDKYGEDNEAWSEAGCRQQVR